MNYYYFYFYRQTKIEYQFLKIFFCHLIRDIKTLTLFQYTLSFLKTTKNNVLRFQNKSKNIMKCITLTLNLLT